MRTIYKIHAKISNTGSIHDIAATETRSIAFGKDCIYAVVLASYYGGKGYTTHKSEAAAIAKSRKLDAENFSHVIIDTSGKKYSVIQDYHGYKLEKLKDY
jgi:hypothetical protein